MRTRASGLLAWCGDMYQFGSVTLCSKEATAAAAAASSTADSAVDAITRAATTT